MSRLWDKGEPIDDLVLRFTVGDDPTWDARLLPYDIRGSIAHATMLFEAGYLSAEDLASIKRGFTELAASFARGEWKITLQDEDVHTALETRLTALIGEAGARIHLGRSRNDQVLTAVRLYLKEAVAELKELGLRVLLSLKTIEDEQGSVVLPGYTHLQRAMPSTVGLWASGWHAELLDDLEGLSRVLPRLDRCPLGSAAGYGVPILRLDRRRVAELLGFAAPHEPVTAVQNSRGKAESELGFAICLLLQDLGRIASDLCLYATAEFGFVELPAKFTTGSSIMPQKRNPDVFELVRGRAARASGDLQALLALTSKMTSGYHRDLQLLKAPIFRLLDEAADVQMVMARALPGVRFRPERCRSALDSSLYATEAAYRLVEQEGVPFRDAYRRIAAQLARGDGAAP